MNKKELKERAQEIRADYANGMKRFQLKEKYKISDMQIIDVLGRVYLRRITRKKRSNQAVVAAPTIENKTSVKERINHCLIRLGLDPIPPGTSPMDALERIAFALEKVGESW